MNLCTCNVLETSIICFYVLCLHIIIRKNFHSLSICGKSLGRDFFSYIDKLIILFLFYEEICFYDMILAFYYIHKNNDLLQNRCEIDISMLCSYFH